MTGLAMALTRPDRMYRGYVFDLDGTLYLGDGLIPGAARTLEAIRTAGSRAIFLTNNPTSLPIDYAAKLSRLGIAATRDDVVSSTDALVRYLHRHAEGARVLAITEPLLVELLRAEGFEVVTDPEQTDVVVVAWDRTFDYAKLTAAYLAVRRGARLIATNPDPYCPTPDGGLPDCAAMLAAIEASSGGHAEAIVGKPSEHMAATVLDRLGFSPDDTVLVGDRLLTDVRMARQAGMHAALVMTGATSKADLDASPERPDFLLTDVTELIPT